MQEEINQLRKELDELKSLYFKDNFSNSQIFRKDSTFSGKVGFYSKVPVSQQGAVTSPTGGTTVDAEARIAIGQIKTALYNLGLTL